MHEQKNQTYASNREPVFSDIDSEYYAKLPSKSTGDLSKYKHGRIKLFIRELNIYKYRQSC